MGGMCRIEVRQSNAIASPAARYVRIAPAFQQSGFGSPCPLSDTGTRDIRLPAESAGAVPAPPGRGYARDPGRSEPRSAQVRPGRRPDESTVIKYLSMAGGDPEQAARLRRFMLASAAYAACIPLVWLASRFNLIAPKPAWILVAMMVVVNAGLYVGVSHRPESEIQRPQLDLAAVFVGNVVVMLRRVQLRPGARRRAQP